MVLSRAKRLEKKKDFQKAKLKAGKSKAKTSNATETNFRSQSVIVKSQSISVELPSASAQIANHISLLGSRSDVQRKESLNALTNYGGLGVLPIVTLLPACLPLMTDGSRGVREQLLKLLKSVPIDHLKGYESKFVLHLQTGLTHISMEVCSASLDVLGWASEVFGQALVSCNGGWHKILKCFLLLFGWSNAKQNQLRAGNEWSNSATSLERFSKDRKAMTKALDILSKFLALGLADHEADHLGSPSLNPLFTHHIQPHLLPRYPQAFASIALYGTHQDDAFAPHNDPIGRKKILCEQFLEPIEKGLSTVRKQGGEHGRLAAVVRKVLSDNSIS